MLLVIRAHTVTFICHIELFCGLIGINNTFIVLLYDYDALLQIIQDELIASPFKLRAKIAEAELCEYHVNDQAAQ